LSTAINASGNADVMPDAYGAAGSITTSSTFGRRASVRWILDDHSPSFDRGAVAAAGQVGGGGEVGAVAGLGGLAGQRDREHRLTDPGRRSAARSSGSPGSGSSPGR